jgi:CubicO group peptidase (beta-lactamase class C family)
MLRGLKWFGFLLLIINPILFLTGTDYIYRAAIYQQPGIDDLKLFPYRVVSASSSPQPWPISASYNTTEMPVEMASALTDFKSVAFLAIQDGQVIHELYWGGYGPEVNSNSFSAGKSIVAALIGRALMLGHINSIDQPVADFLPSFNTVERAAITVRHVLQMSSGLNFQESYSKPISDTTEAYYGDDLVGLIERLSPESPPGVSWKYRSGDTQILAMVLEQATGQTVSSFAATELWQPLGATSDAQWSLDRRGGIEKAYCCFYSNPRDFARVAQLYLRHGRAGDQQLLPFEFVEQSVVPHGLPDAKTGLRSDYYGLHWWRLNHQDTEVFYMRGILGQYVWVIPSRDLIVVRLGHQRSPVKRAGHPQDVYTYIEGILEMFPVQGQ